LSVTPGAGASPGSGEGRVARFWDERAARYDGHYDASGPDGYSLRARLALTLRLVGEGPGAVLDPGMGAGRLCEALARRRWTVFGVDMSGEMVALARERIPDARERLVQASVEDLPFPDASFDTIAATGVLEYTDVPRALAELARVLRPGASAVVSYPNPTALYALWKTRIWYPALSPAKRLLRRPHAAAPKGGPALAASRFTKALETAGLRVESVHHTGYLVLPAPLDDLFPGLATRLGRRLEGSGPRLGRVLATQVLYVSRKPSPTVDGSASPADDVEEGADR